MALYGSLFGTYLGGNMKKRLRRFAAIELVDKFIEGIPHGLTSRVINDVLYGAIASGEAFGKLGAYLEQDDVRKIRLECESVFQKASEPLIKSGNVSAITPQESERLAPKVVEASVTPRRTINI
jgi:hypothetical protein